MTAIFADLEIHTGTFAYIGVCCVMTPLLGLALLCLAISFGSKVAAKSVERAEQSADDLDARGRRSEAIQNRKVKPSDGPDSNDQ